MVLMSDTHEQHRKVDVPDGDLLIHAGDFTYFNRSPSAVRDFNQWLHSMPHKYKVVIPGNHESRPGGPAWREQITGAVVLINEGIELAGLRIWSSPVTPGDWGAFGSGTEDELERAYARIPDVTDVLITHGPPFGILDLQSDSDEPQGCRQLLEAVRRVTPRLHVFGHIHPSYGMVCSGGTTFVNAALAGPGYGVTKRPITFAIASTVA